MRVLVEAGQASPGGIPGIPTWSEEAALFEQAANAAPSVLFIDEFDALVPDRAAMGGHQTLAENAPRGPKNKKKLSRQFCGGK